MIAVSEDADAELAAARTEANLGGRGGSGGSRCSAPGSRRADGCSRQRHELTTQADPILSPFTSPTRISAARIGQVIEHAREMLRSRRLDQVRDQDRLRLGLTTRLFAASGVRASWKRLG